MNRKHIYRLLLMLVLLGSGGAVYYLAYEQLPERGSLERDETCPEVSTVRYVVDGDTIILKTGQRIRYLGINAPEIRTREGEQVKGWFSDHRRFADETLAFHKKLVAGKEVRLEYDEEKRDKYGRLLAYVYVGDKFVNEEMLRNGYALFYPFPPNTKYLDELWKAQDEAMSRMSGVWGHALAERIPYELAKHYVGDVKVVEGTVVDSFESPAAFNLLFDKKIKWGFSAVILKSHTHFFEEAGMPVPSSFLGKRVRLWGYIRVFNGPQITVMHPYQMKILAEKTPEDAYGEHEAADSGIPEPAK